MKHYNQPETMILQINAQTMQMQSASAPEPVYSPAASLESVTKTGGEW